MFFHVTMTHTADNCPGNSPEKMAAFIAALENLDTIAAEANVKVHFAVTAAPDHVSYALLEADSHPSILRILSAIPIRQDFKISPVSRDRDIIAMAKQMMAMGPK